MKVRLLHDSSSRRVSGARPGQRGSVPRQKQLLIRLSDEEYDSIAAAAATVVLALANWARLILLRAAKSIGISKDT